MNWLDTVNIRIMKEEDLPLIEWDGKYSRYRRIYREVFRNLQSGIAYPYVAETKENGLIGQVFLTEKLPNVNFSPDRRYLFLSSFRIKEAFRDKGLGALLLRICELTAKDKKIRDIFLNCAQKNILGLHFYETHGFTKVREDPGEWTFINENGNVITEVEPAWTMVKQIQ